MHSLLFSLPDVKGKWLRGGTTKGGQPCLPFLRTTTDRDLLIGKNLCSKSSCSTGWRTWWSALSIHSAISAKRTQFPFLPKKSSHTQNNIQQWMSRFCYICAIGSEFSAQEHCNCILRIQGLKTSPSWQCPKPWGVHDIIDHYPDDTLTTMQCRGVQPTDRWQHKVKWHLDTWVW